MQQNKNIHFKNLFFFKAIILLFFLLLINNLVFAGPQSPEFVRTKEWKVTRGDSGKIILTTKAVFYNPNKSKAKLKYIILNIYANEKLIGTVTQIEKLKIYGQSSFDIPLRIELDLKKSGINVLETVLNLMSNNKFLIDMIGYVKMNVFCIPFKVQVDEKQEFAIKDFIK